MDDVWEELEESTYEAALREREWKRMESAHAVSGFREGIEAGRSETSQSGFNSGFADGADYSMSLGKLLGVVSVLETFYGNHTTLPDNKLTCELTSLKTELEQLGNQTPNPTLTPLHQPPELQPFQEKCKLLCKELGLNVVL